MKKLSKRYFDKSVPWALFHVNQKTGEKVRYQREFFPATSEAEAMRAAADSRIGGARGVAYGDVWFTEAHPEIET